VWARLVGVAFGGALLLTAAQLGVGGGLGLLDWRSPDQAAWDRALTWVPFIFAAAVLGGVAVARRRLSGFGPHPLLRIAVAAAAGAGALVALPLVWLPVRIGVAGVQDPASTVVACAAAGAAVGVLFGLASLAWGPVAAGVTASVLWLWVAALASVTLAALDGVAAGARLGVIEAPGRSDWWSGPYPMVGLYATLALTVAATARRLGASRRQIALSGLAGPALLASAYAIAGGTSDGDVRTATLVAAAAGLLASTSLALRAADPVALTAASAPVEDPARTAALAEAARRARAVEEVPRPRRARKSSPSPATTTVSSAEPAARKGSGRRSTTTTATTTEAAPSSTTSTASAGVAAKADPGRKRKTPERPVETGAQAKPATRERRAAAKAASTPAASTPAPAPSSVTDTEGLSRREREHVKWMETLLNTPPDPTLTPRRRKASSS